MRIVLFCHSLLSDWNNDGAHFLRGVVSELAARGHEVRVFERRDAWSVQHLVSEHGPALLDEARLVYPALDVVRYQPGDLDLQAALDGAGLVIVHEWNDPELVRRIGAHRARSGAGGYRLFFHDTRPSAIPDPAPMSRHDLSAYDGVLASGRVARDLYLADGAARRAFVWREAADTAIFRPRWAPRIERDLVWIGDHGDGDRAAELDEFLIGPVRDLRLRAIVYGARYPDRALRALDRAGIVHGGWLPGHRIPDAFARARVAVHIPRRPREGTLPGVPTVRPFEALACAVPVVSAPWNDIDGLFAAGRDYLVAANGREMREHLAGLLADPAAAEEMASRGRRTVLARHTCAHRADELLGIAADLGPPAPPRRGAVILAAA